MHGQKYFLPQISHTGLKQQEGEQMVTELIPLNVSFDIKISSCTLFSQMNVIILSHISTVPLSENDVTELDIYKTLQSYVQTALKYISVDV